MLSEKDIEKLIQPIIDRQCLINDYVIKKIAQRVKEVGTLLPSDVYKLERLLKSGADVREINKKVAELTNLNVADIKKLIKTVALQAYLDVKPFYDYRHKPFIPLKDNEPLQKIITAIANQTAGAYVNLSKAQAFMLRDRKNPKRLIPTSLAKTYQSIIDEAVQASQSGVIDYDTSMRRSMNQLVDSGIRHVIYQPESGRIFTQRLDTAVRRNLLDGIRAINQGVQDETGKQYGADGKEISVHQFSAPDHEPIQGHQFTNEQYEKLQAGEDFEDANGKKFTGIARPIGVLNCRHFTYSIILGVNKPNFTQEELDKLIAANAKGYTTPDGKHYTMYECTQKQRDLETNIRRAKEKQMAFESSGDEQGAQEARAKVVYYEKLYNYFSNRSGLVVKPKKTRVSGYRA